MRESNHFYFILFFFNKLKLTFLKFPIKLKLLFCIDYYYCKSNDKYSIKKIRKFKLSI